MKDQLQAQIEERLIVGWAVVLAERLAGEKHAEGVAAGAFDYWMGVLDEMPKKEILRLGRVLWNAWCWDHLEAI